MLQAAQRCRTTNSSERHHARGVEQGCVQVTVVVAVPGDDVSGAARGHARVEREAGIMRTEVRNPSRLGHNQAVRVEKREHGHYVTGMGSTLQVRNGVSAAVPQDRVRVTLVHEGQRRQSGRAGRLALRPRRSSGSRAHSVPHPPRARRNPARSRRGRAATAGSRRSTVRQRRDRLRVTARGPVIDVRQADRKGAGEHERDAPRQRRSASTRRLALQASRMRRRSSKCTSIPNCRGR